MKVAIYTRVSTDNQAEVEFNSCDAQEAKIRSFIASQDKMDIVKAYSDQGYSGANTDRPALKEMIWDIQQKKIDLVISYKIDRLTRSPKDFYQLIEIFEQFNVNFISVTERFDTSTPAGRLLRNIMLTFAQFERELISERTKDKMLERAKKGFWHGGPAPYGYKLENKRLVINPQEAVTIKYIFSNYATTKSTGVVYNNLKKRKMLYRNGLPLTKTTIGHILRGVIYTGKIKYGKEIYSGLHEPIISETVFNSVQLMRKSYNKKSRVFNNTLFPGLIKCTECGSVMSSVFTNKLKKGKRTRYYYYRCSSIDKRDHGFCDIKQISADRLDQLIVNYLDNATKNNQYLDSLIFTLNNSAESASKGLELKGDRSPYTAEKLRIIMQSIVEASKLCGKYEKRDILKRHIESIIYSKETIEVKLLYSESVAPCLIDVRAASDLLRRSPAEVKFSTDHKDGAAFRQLSSPQSRPTAKVRTKKEAPRVGLEPTTP